MPNARRPTTPAWFKILFVVCVLLGAAVLGLFGWGLVELILFIQRH